MGPGGGPEGLTESQRQGESISTDYQLVTPQEAPVDEKHPNPTDSRSVCYINIFLFCNDIIRSLNKKNLPDLETNGADNHILCNT